MRNARISAISAENDAWLRRATATAVAEIKQLIGPQGPVRSDTPAGRLGQSELTWIVSTVVWAWISVRAEQAASEELDPERAVRVTRLDPDPWDLGAVKAILPDLAKSCASFDWSRPARQWTKDELAEFLLKGFNLIQRAVRARDAIEEQIAGKPTNPNVVARELNRAGGNPMMTVDEIKADVKF